MQREKNRQKRTHEVPEEQVVLDDKGADLAERLGVARVAVGQQLAPEAPALDVEHAARQDIEQRRLAGPWIDCWNVLGGLWWGVIGRV